MNDNIPQFKVNMNVATSVQLGKVLNSGFIGQGKVVDAFEEALQRYLKFDNAITVNSGTSALWLALHLAGVGYGDTIISTPMTCSATNEVIVLRGINILWADVDEYGNLSPDTVEQALKYRDDMVRGGRNGIKAIMAVDWGGLPCDYDGIREVAPDIPIIEDAAHAFGATYKKQPISRSGGDYVAFSFQAIKHLTCGDGGLLVVPEEQYERAKLLRWYGLDRTQGDAMRCRQDIIEAGYKFHMNDISAQIGLSNLSSGKWAVEEHRKHAVEYDELFIPRGLVPEPPSDRESSYWVYTIHVPRPLEFEQYMKGKNISVSQVHNRNDHYTCFSKYRRKLPNLDEWFSTMSAIPVGWWLTRYERERIVDAVIEWVT